MKLGILEKTYHERPLKERLMGIDFGRKRLGLAISNHAQDTASPLATLKRSRFALDADELADYIREYDVRGLVFGWPLNMDGTPGAMCERVRSFADEVIRVPEIREQIVWMSAFDERLSTQTVEEFLVKDVDMSRTKRKNVIDKLAACRILQAALEHIHYLEN